MSKGVIEPESLCHWVLERTSLRLPNEWRDGRELTGKYVVSTFTGSQTLFYHLNPLCLLVLSVSNR